MAKREDVYKQQLQELGLYEPAFEPLIRDLAKAERRRTRVEKAWSATAPPGGKPSFLDPHWAILQQLEREILIYREALGLTPKALRRLRGQPTTGGGSMTELIGEKLSAIQARVESYAAPVFNPDTGKPVWEEAPDA